jgi:hypothetical protein
VGAFIWNNIRLTALPVDAVKRCLGLALAPGTVYYYAGAQHHAFFEPDKRQREAICKPHYMDVVSAPTHVGQQPQHVGKSFELVRVTAAGPIILMGIRLKPIKKSGYYVVKSTYPINVDTLERRIRIGTLVPV